MTPNGLKRISMNSKNLISIRTAEKTDIPQLLLLYQCLELDNTHTLSYNSALELFELISTYPYYWIYCAEYGQAIVGTFCLHIMHKMEHAGLPYGIIDSVAVAPNVQGKGVGTEMMKFAIIQCKEYRCYKVTLSSQQSRYQAHSFYKKLGFKQYGYSFTLPL